MPTRVNETDSNRAVPIELAGKWIAWNSEHTKIIAHAETLQQLWQIVREGTFQDPVFEKVPQANVRFVGMR